MQIYKEKSTLFFFGKVIRCVRNTPVAEKFTVPTSNTENTQQWRQCGVAPLCSRKLHFYLPSSDEQRVSISQHQPEVVSVSIVPCEAVHVIFRSCGQQNIREFQTTDLESKLGRNLRKNEHTGLTKIADGLDV